MPTSLEILNMGDSVFNNNKFTGGIPAEWSSMTNLKELNMYYCGLDGESCVCSVQQNRRQLRSESRTGPPLPETLRLLAPLAPKLEKLHLSDNKLSGAITEDIAAFTKLTELQLYDLGLEGACVEPDTHKKEANRGNFLARSLCTQARSRPSSGG